MLGGAADGGCLGAGDEPGEGAWGPGVWAGEVGVCGPDEEAHSPALEGFFGGDSGVEYGGCGLKEPGVPKGVEFVWGELGRLAFDVGFECDQGVFAGKEPACEDGGEGLVECGGVEEFLGGGKAGFGPAAPYGFEVWGGVNEGLGVAVDLGACDGSSEGGRSGGGEGIGLGGYGAEPAY